MENKRCYEMSSKDMFGHDGGCSREWGLEVMLFPEKFEGKTYGKSGFHFYEYLQRNGFNVKYDPKME